MKRPGGFDERINIVFVVDNMRVGGTELNAVRTAQHLRQAGLDLKVICLGGDGPLTARYRELGIPVISMPLASLYGWSMLSSGWRFARFLRANRVQVVHAHDMYSNVFATPWARAARVPAVVASRRWWHSLPNAKLQLGNRVAFHLAHGVLTNSRTVARSVREKDGVSPARVWVVQNFVDDDAFAVLSDTERQAIRAKWGVPPNALVIGCVARLVPIKDHKTLVESFVELRTRTTMPLHLVFIGDGESRQDLEDLVRRRGIVEATSFAGEVRDAGNQHRAFDISALSSLSEGFPNSLLEAMAAGTPVVATDVGGVPDAIEDDGCGLLVPPGRPTELAAALLSLVEDPTRRSRMGASGRIRASERFRAGPALDALKSMYFALLGKRRSS